MEIMVANPFVVLAGEKVPLLEKLYLRNLPLDLRRCGSKFEARNSNQGIKAVKALSLADEWCDYLLAWTIKSTAAAC